LAARPVSTWQQTGVADVHQRQQTSEGSQRGMKVCTCHLCLFFIRETKCYTCVITGGWEHTASAEPVGHTSCYYLRQRRRYMFLPGRASGLLSLRPTLFRNHAIHQNHTTFIIFSHFKCWKSKTRLRQGRINECAWALFSKTGHGPVHRESVKTKDTTAGLLEKIAVA